MTYTYTPAAPDVERIYIHEIIDIRHKARRAWLDWFCGWTQRGINMPNRTNRNFGVWTTVDYAGRWPEAIVMWERASKEALVTGAAKVWAHYNTDDMSGDRWNASWKGAPGEIRDTQGMDRILASTKYSPTMEQLVERGVKGDLYIHNHINTRPGEIHDHLETLGRDWAPIAERLGLKFVGAFRTLLVNDDQGVSIWAAPTWEAWAEFEDRRRTDSEALDWRAEVCARGVTWDGRMLVGAGCNPLDTGVLL